MTAAINDATTLASWLVEQAPDAIIFADREGCVRLWNPAAEALFGFHASAVQGQRLDFMIPEKLRAAHWRGFEAAMQTGDTRHHGKALPTKALCADGRQIYVSMSFGIVRDTSGQVIGSLAQARDITEAYLKERDEKARLKQLEQQLADKGGAQ